MELKKYRTSLGTYYLPDIETDIIANEMRHGRIYDPEVVDTARYFITRGSAVLDLGANFGQMSLLFSKSVGDAGRVYSFEAASDIFEVLVKNIQENHKSNIIPVCKAVYNKTGELKFYPVPDITDHFDTYGAYGIDPNATGGRIVETITIDSMDIREPISFMKVDIEGSELFALQGAKKTIMRNRMPILFEFQEPLQKKFGTSFTEYMRFIDEEIGYKVIDVLFGINFLIIPKEMPVPNLIHWKHRKWNMYIPRILGRLHGLKKSLGVTKTLVKL